MVDEYEGQWFGIVSMSKLRIDESMRERKRDMGEKVCGKKEGKEREGQEVREEERGGGL